jgi:hypothetical protein
LSKELSDCFVTQHVVYNQEPLVRDPFQLCACTYVYPDISHAYPITYKVLFGLAEGKGTAMELIHAATYCRVMNYVTCLVAAFSRR